MRILASARFTLMYSLSFLLTNTLMAGVKFLGCIGAYFLALVTDKFQLAEGSATEEDLRQLEDNNS